MRASHPDNHYTVVVGSRQMSAQFEVPEPIICSPYEEPAFHWHLDEGQDPEKRPERRPASYFYREPSRGDEGEAAGVAVVLPLVNLDRERLAQWRTDGYPGATRTTPELLNYWRRDGRQHRLFFAQLETKGLDELADVKAHAAERWVSAVNADGSMATWSFAMARKVAEVRDILDRQ